MPIVMALARKGSFAGPARDLQGKLRHLRKEAVLLAKVC